MQVLALIEDPDARSAEGLQTAAVTYGTEAKTLAAQFECDTDDAANAVVEATAAFRQLGGRIVWMEAESDDHGIETPIVGVSEYADMKNVTRQHASAISQYASFPAPTTVLRSGPVWPLAAIAVHEATHKRRGRARRSRVRA